MSVEVQELSHVVQALYLHPQYLQSLDVQTWLQNQCFPHHWDDPHSPQQLLHCCDSCHLIWFLLLTLLFHLYHLLQPQLSCPFSYLS